MNISNTCAAFLGILALIVALVLGTSRSERARTLLHDAEAEFTQTLRRADETTAYLERPPQRMRFDNDRIAAAANKTGIAFAEAEAFLAELEAVSCTHSRIFDPSLK